jgi:hypothetical protein
MSNPKVKPQDPNKLKKAKMDYLEMLRGNTGGNRSGIDNKASQDVHVKGQAKKTAPKYKKV